VAFNQDYLKQIKWRPTLLVGGLDREVRVAVLDTGLSPRQPVLWRNVIATYDALGTGSAYDWPAGVDTNGNGEFDEAVGHGTFVTSIIATVAPYAKIAVARVADSDGIATSWSMIKGLVFAVNNGCEIANVSLGSADQPAALGDVIEWADGMGLVVVAGSGNDSTDRALYPSRFSEVIGVSGVDAKYRKADFSNWDGHLRQAAPSVSIAGAWWKGGMMGWSGTSFASPFVAGCLADTARKRAVWTPDQVRSLLDTVGQNIDQFNPLYAGELGLLVDWQALLNAQATVPTIYATRR
jgi:subtilisin family serine protease